MYMEMVAVGQTVEQGAKLLRASPAASAALLRQSSRAAGMSLFASFHSVTSDSSGDHEISSVYSFAARTLPVLKNFSHLTFLVVPPTEMVFPSPAGGLLLSKPDSPFLVQVFQIDHFTWKVTLVRAPRLTVPLKPLYSFSRLPDATVVVPALVGVL